MLTNNVREWEPLWRAMLPVDEIFELVVDSAFVGLRKPDPAIYELTLRRLREHDAEALGDLEFSECVFIDDTEVNCDAARDLGIRRPLPRQRSGDRRAPRSARLVVGAGAVPDVELDRLDGQLHQAGGESHSSTVSSARSSVTPRSTASSPRKPAASLSASRRCWPRAEGAA